MEPKKLPENLRKCSENLQAQMSELQFLKRRFFVELFNVAKLSKF